MTEIKKKPISQLTSADIELLKNNDYKVIIKDNKVIAIVRGI